jgi:hypothetical protein
MRLAWLFVRLRWRLFINHLKGAAHRDGVERASRAGALIAPALTIAGLGCAAALFGVLGLAAGWIAGGRPETPAGSMVALRIVLAAMGLLVMVTSVFSTTQTGLTAHPRLRLLPIPRRVLHRIDLVAGALVDGAIVTLAPGLILFAIGLAASGRPAASLVAVTASIAMLTLLAALRSVVSLSIGRVLQRRRSAEVLTLISVVGLSLVSAVPLFFHEVFRKSSRLSLGDLIGELPGWMRLAPPDLYATAVDSALAGNITAALGALVLLAGEGAVLFALSSRLHRRLLDSAIAGGGRRRRDRRVAPLPRLPLLTSATSAVAIVQARTALRSVRGRLVVLLPGAIVAVLYTLARRMPGEIPAGFLVASSTDAVLAFGLAFSLYALLAFTMNQFAVDRAGLTLQFLAPITDTELIRGKAVGCGLLFAAQAGVCAVSLGAVMAAIPPLSSVTVALSGLISYLVMAPAAAAASALLPVRSDMSKTGTGGSPHGLAMLGGTLAIALLTTIEWRVLSFGSGDDPWRTLTAAAFVAAAAAAANGVGLSRLATIVGRRRENIVLVVHASSSG